MRKIKPPEINPGVFTVAGKNLRAWRARELTDVRDWLLDEHRKLH